MGEHGELTGRQSSTVAQLLQHALQADSPLTDHGGERGAEVLAELLHSLLSGEVVTPVSAQLRTELRRLLATMAYARAPDSCFELPDCFALPHPEHALAPPGIMLNAYGLQKLDRTAARDAIALDLLVTAVSMLVERLMSATSGS